MRSQRYADLRREFDAKKRAAALEKAAPEAYKLVKGRMGTEKGAQALAGKYGCSVARAALLSLSELTKGQETRRQQALMAVSSWNEDD